MSAVPDSFNEIRVRKEQAAKRDSICAPASYDLFGVLGCTRGRILSRSGTPAQAFVSAK